MIHPLQAMDPEDTAGFMKAGGRLAILDDYGLGDETLTRFHIERIPPPSRPVAALRNRPPCDRRAGGRRRRGPRDGPHPVVATCSSSSPTAPPGSATPPLAGAAHPRHRRAHGIIAVLARSARAASSRWATLGGHQPDAPLPGQPGVRERARALPRRRRRGDAPSGAALHRDQPLRRGGIVRRRGRRAQGSSRRSSPRHALAEARRDGFPAWTHSLLAACAALGLASWVARPGPAVQEPAAPLRAPHPAGRAGRRRRAFAVLAAPSSPRSLALLELRSALYEGLRRSSGSGSTPAPRRSRGWPSRRDGLTSARTRP